MNKLTTYIIYSHTIILNGSTGCGKSHIVLDLIEKEYNIVTASILSAQCYDGIRHIMPRDG